MQMPSTSFPLSQVDSETLKAGEHLIETHEVSSDKLDLKTAETMLFEGNYVGQMEMLADAKTVAEYLDSHQDWFTRCAQPISVEQISDHGYALILGRFTSLNFAVEPKIGLHLLPHEEGTYRIETIPVPNYEPKGYDVDFKAVMTLAENTAANSTEALADQQTTHVKWELKLLTWVQMPRFIQALPQALVKTSGDKLLNQIVKQISRRLTRKVQEDFHKTLNLPLPDSARRGFWQR